MKNKTKNSSRKGITAILFVAMIASVLAVTPVVQAGLSTNDMNTGLTPTDIVNTLVGAGVTVSNVQYTGVPIAAGNFSGGTGIIGFEDGIILSTGDIADVIGPNTYDDTTTNNSQLGDPDLDTLITGYTTFDAAVLEFDFVPTSDVVTFEYVFGSEEYNEYVYSSYNNIFGFFLNGVNVALIPGTTTPVAINTVNGGNPYGDPNAANPAYFRNNDLQDGGGSIDTELDGLTVVMSVTANVNVGVTNHIKLAVADAGDAILDSDVFIRATSFQAPMLTLSPLTDTNPIGSSHMLTATLVDVNGTAIPGATITFTVTAGPHVSATGTAVTDLNGEATWSYTGTTAGIDTIVAIGAAETSNSVYKTWESYVTVESADIGGTPENIFQIGDPVYAIGSGYAASTTYDLYVVEDTTWTDGMAIPSRVGGTESSVITDASGNIPAGTLIWTSSSVAGNYDIVVDVNGNGQYDTGIDALDSNMDTGFEIIQITRPVGTIVGSMVAIPVVAIIVTVFLMSRRKREE